MLTDEKARRRMAVEFRDDEPDEWEKNEWKWARSEHEMERKDDELYLTAIVSFCVGHRAAEEAVERALSELRGVWDLENDEERAQLIEALRAALREEGT